MYNIVLVGCGHMGAVHLDDETPEYTYNYGLMTLKMTDGTVAYYEAGWGGAIAAENKKEFIGSKGRITITVFKADKEISLK